MTKESKRRAIPGYHGEYLRVDLTRGNWSRVPIPVNVLRDYVGGTGLGVYVMFAEHAPTCDALHPDAPLAFVFSPLVGSALTTSAKFAVVAKSPLTNRFNDSLASSGFAIAGKKCGCDAIVVTGKAAEPMVLVIDDGEVRLESASELVGLDCDRTQARVRERLGANFRVAAIGPAGETLVRFATISHDGRHAGRGGSGAVMGAKNLKALAVRGTRLCPWAQPDKLARYAQSLSRRSFGPATEKYRELGTAANLLLFNRLNTLPTRNFQRSSFDRAERIAPELLSTEHRHVRDYCTACTIGCEHIYSLGNEAEANNGGKRDGVRIEYENLFALGSLCGVGDAKSVLRASRRCDELGLDTISTGGTIAFAMECVERGMLDEPWLRFGDGDALLKAIELTAGRRGIGDLLAEGSRKMARIIGQGSMRFAAQVKGLEIPGYEPRAMQAMGLGFAVNARGADHNRSGAYEADFSGQPGTDRLHISRSSVELAIASENRSALMDSLIICKFLRGVFDDLFDESALMLTLVTGFEYSASDMLAMANRIIDAKKMFNIRSGWQPEEDDLPARFVEDALPDAADARLSRPKLHEMIRYYNRLRGWADDGWVPDDHARSLGLPNV
jgi:aldehyde:ferredoxin oxidoreductase